MSREIRYVVLGNGAAGNAAAERLRQNDPGSSVTLVAAERHPHYSRVALPRYVRGQIAEEKLMMRTFEDYRRLGIDLLSGIAATSVDPSRKMVMCADGSILPYDKLLIATGGRPKPSTWQLSDAPRSSLVFQTIEDARRIIEASESARQVLVVGGGFIGYELAESIAHRNTAKVVWMMRGPWFLHNVLDAPAGLICNILAAEAGVEIITGDSIQSVTANSAGFHVTTAGARRMDVDVIAQGIGIDYYAEPALSAGLNAEPGIRTDSRLRTRIPDIYAAGDIALFENEETGRLMQMGSWESALAQGRLAADNMAGGDEPFQDVPTYTTSLFGSNLAVLGDMTRNGPESRVHTVRSGDRGYRRFHIRKDRLVGAVLIGSPKGRKRLIEMIKQGTPVTPDPQAMSEFAVA